MALGDRQLLLVDAMIKGTKMYKHAFGRYRLPHCHMKPPTSGSDPAYPCGSFLSEEGIAPSPSFTRTVTTQRDYKATTLRQCRRSDIKHVSFFQLGVGTGQAAISGRESREGSRTCT